MSGLGTFMGLSALTTGVSEFAGGIMDAEAHKAQAEFQKNQYEFSKKVADFQASDAVKRGERAAKQVRQAGNKMIGTQRASLAAQGIELDSGTALDIQEETAAFTEMDALTVKINSLREAWGYKVQSANYLAQGQYAQTAGQFKAAGSIMTGGLGFAGGAMDYLRYTGGFQKPSPIATQSSGGGGAYNSYGYSTYGGAPGMVG